MAFKVLLADDSAAIKKVVQLSLQDFGVEIKSVGSGKDVLDVCRSFRPDIAFVDVLLPHKTGYEVVAEIKKDAQLKATPIVMLWSAFLAFDEGKFKASGAEEKLEKPFEVATLRSLVTKLVPKLSGSPVARHLDFPKIDFDQPIGAVPPPKPIAQPAPVKAAAANALPPIPSPAAGQDATPKEEWSMASFEDIGSFTNQMKDLQEKSTDVPKIPDMPFLATTVKPEFSQTTVVPPSTSPSFGEEEQWVRKDVSSKFKVPVPMESEDENSVAFQYTQNDISDTSFLFKPASADQTSIHSAHDVKTSPGAAEKPNVETPKNDVPKEAAPSAVPASVGLSEMDLLKLKQETRDAVEKAVWKLVPEIASQIIREEIQRLLGDEK